MRGKILVKWMRGSDKKFEVNIFMFWQGRNGSSMKTNSVY